MKILLIFLFLSLLSNKIYTQESAGYFPLKVGNKWIYNWIYSGGASGRTGVTITRDTTINSKKYYECSFPSMGNFLRVDSLSGNIYAYGPSSCQNQETLMDSLYSKKFDSTYLCGQPYRMRYDTGSITLFNNISSSKMFGETIVLAVTGRKYANGFGLYNIVIGDPFTTSYSLSGCVINGSVYGDTTLTSVKLFGTEVPSDFSLYQNYPNPFNPKTIIKFNITSNVKGQTSDVKLIVHNSLGKEVVTLVNEKLSAGSYEVEFDGSNLASGIYFYRIVIHSDRLVSEDFTDTKHMILLK